MKNGIPTMTHIFDPNSDITTLDDKILQEYIKKFGPLKQHLVEDLKHHLIEDEPSDRELEEFY